MVLKKLPLALVLLMMLSCSSCNVFHQSSQRKVEKKEAADKRKAATEMKKLERAHFNRQSRETKKMMRQSKRASKKLRKVKRR